MPQTSGPPRPLPAQRAFLLQLHAESDPALGRFVGRVEHVQSGRASQFATLEEFLAFLAQVLTPAHRSISDLVGRTSMAL